MSGNIFLPMRADDTGSAHITFAEPTYETWDVVLQLDTRYKVKGPGSAGDVRVGSINIATGIPGWFDPGHIADAMRRRA